MSIGDPGIWRLNVLQETVLKKITSSYVFLRLIKWEGAQPKEAYSVKELLGDIEIGIFRELNTGDAIGRSRRLLQKTYLLRLIELIKPASSKGADFIENSPCTKQLY